MFCLAVMGRAAQAQTVTSVTCSPSTVVGGSHSELIVHLSADAASAVTVTLSSDSAAATLPASMTIASGSDYGTLIFGTSGVDASTVATLTATVGSSSASGSITVNPAVLASIGIVPTPITGGNTATVYAYLNGPAGPSGVTVSLSSSNSAVAAAPATLTVAAGALNGKASVTTVAVTSSTKVTITGTLGATTQSSILQVVPVLAVTSVFRSPATVVGGSHSELVVRMSTAALSTATVSLSSNSPAATVPASMTINAGSDYGTLIIATSGVDASTVATLTATLGSSSAGGSITVSPATLRSIVVSPSPITGGDTTIVFAYLNGQAGPSGLTVSLSSSNSGVAAAPASLTVVPGALNAKASVTTVGVDSSTNVTITGTLGGTSHSSTLKVVPAALRLVALGLSTIVGGKGGNNLYVDLNGQAGPSGVVVQLSSNVPGVATVPASVTVAAGSTAGFVAISTSVVGVNVPVILTGQIGSDPAVSGTLLVESPVASPWPVQGGSMFQTNVGPGSGATGTVLWTCQTRPSGFGGQSQPVIGTGGDIYFANYYGLYAVSPSGAVLWQKTGDSYGNAQLGVGGDGTVYCTTAGGSLLAFNSLGQQKWGIVGQNSTFLVETAPSIGLDGTIYVGTYTSNGPSITAINPDKTVKWTQAMPGVFWDEAGYPSGPALGPDGTIYFATSNYPDNFPACGMNLSALTPAGAVKWSLALPGLSDQRAIVVVGPDGTLYVEGYAVTWLSQDTDTLATGVCAVSPSGSLKWTYLSPNNGDETFVPPAIGADGTVYFGTVGFGFYALTANGTLKWTFDAGGYIGVVPAIDSKGVIYVVASNSNSGNVPYTLYALNPDGSEKWSLPFGSADSGGANAGPIIGADGTLYFTTQVGLVAIH